MARVSTSLPPHFSSVILSKKLSGIRKFSNLLTGYRLCFSMKSLIYWSNPPDSSSFYKRLKTLAANLSRTYPTATSTVIPNIVCNPTPLVRINYVCLPVMITDRYGNLSWGIFSVSGVFTENLEVMIWASRWFTGIKGTLNYWLNLIAFLIPILRLDI